MDKQKCQSCGATGFAVNGLNCKSCGGQTSSSQENAQKIMDGGGTKAPSPLPSSAVPTIMVEEDEAMGPVAGVPRFL